MQNEIILHGGQRVDLPDFTRLIQYMREEYNETINKILSLQQGVICGFVFSPGTGLVAEFDRSTFRVAVKNDGSLFVDTSISGLPLEIALEDDKTNYLELEIETEETDASDRVFWNIDTEQEFLKNVVTKKVIKATIYVNDTGYTGGSRLPLYRFVTASGAVTAFYDDRVRLYSPSTRGNFAWPTPKNDKEIKDQREMNDALADQISEIKRQPIEDNLTGVDQGTGKFVVAGDRAFYYQGGKKLQIENSTGNDGYYTILSSLFDTDHTDIFVSEPIPDATVDGNTVSRSEWFETPRANIDILWALLEMPTYEEEYVPPADLVIDELIQLPLDGVTGDKQYCAPGGRDLKVFCNRGKWRIDRDYEEYSDGTHPTDPTLITHIKVKHALPGGLVRGVPKTIFIFERRNKGGAILNYETENQIAVADEGTQLSASIKKLDFVGGGVQVVMDGSDTAKVLVAGSSISAFTKTKINNTGSAIPAFSLVALLSTNETEIVLADATDVNDRVVYGITIEEILDGSAGLVQWGGTVANAADGRGWNKTGFCWLDPATPGDMVEGAKPGHAGDVFVGLIEGKDIILRPQYHF